MGRAIATTLVALALLTALVLGGVLTGLDEWGLDHVMPALDPTSPGNGIVTSSAPGLTLELSKPRK